jgi:hypothetical protein
LKKLRQTKKIGQRNIKNNNVEKKKESPLVSLLVSIVIPAIILSKFSTEEYLGILPGFLVALAFPVGYAIYNLLVRKETGFIAIIGFVSIFLTGIIGVFEFPTEWLAVKEAAVPLLIGIAVIVSLKTPYPLVRKLLFNEELLDLKLIDKKLIENNNVFELEKVLVKSTFMVAGSFLLSAFLNFFLTKYIVVSPAGTAAFNEELGTLTAISYPAIALPSTAVMFVALYYIFKQITKLTGLSFEEIMSEQIKEKSK